MDKSLKKVLYNFTRRILQIVFCSVILILMSPIILVTSIAIKLSSQGPILYKGERLGKYRKIFAMYKFRTMYVGTESRVGARLIKNGEGHITPVGKVIRLFKLDELPQFINVIKGDMNLIGPRPLRPALYEKYVQQYPKYPERFKVKPGISGLAQVRGGYYINPENKLRYDMLYIKNRSLGLDIKLTVYTVSLVIKKLFLKFFHTFASRLTHKREIKPINDNSKCVILSFQKLDDNSQIIGLAESRIDETIENLQRNLETNTNCPDIHYYLEHANSMKSSIQENKSSKKKFSSNSTEIVLAVYKDYALKEVVEFLEQEKSLYSDNSELSYALGLIYLANAKYKKAASYFDKTVEIDPNHFDALVNLGICLVNSKKYEQAFEIFQKAKTLDSDNAQLHFMLGITYTKLDSYSEALKQFEKALAIDSNLVEADKNIKLCRHHLGWDTK